MTQGSASTADPQGKVETPQIDSVEMTISMGNRTERLSDQEFLLIKQLIAFREQKLSGDSLKDTLGVKPSAPDRIVEAAMVKLIRKMNALFPVFPLVRRVSRDLWMYTEVPPRKTKR
ncbi:MAG: hypothetical protein KTR33_17080 [Gammaproteobacteria bacterium]|nr:hypothetical protein [Gammaproteobacteria bacterium]